MHKEDENIDSKLIALIGKETGFNQPVNYFDELESSINNNITQSHVDDLKVDITSETGYSIPTGYFEKLTNSIITKIQSTNNNTNSKGEVATDLKVSDDYFSRSYEQILQKTIHENSQPKVVKLSIFKKYIQQWTSIAAIFLISISLIIFIRYKRTETQPAAIVSSHNNLPSLENVEDNELIEALSNEDIGEDVYQLAEYQVSKTDNTTSESVKPDSAKTSKTDQEIEDFLIENVEEIEEI